MKIRTVITVLLLLFPCFLMAQSEQLEREIRIAEGILTELFAENQRDDHPFLAVRNNRVTGDYIPGYGVHFTIGDNLWNRVARMSGGVTVTQPNGNSTSVHFEPDSGISQIPQTDDIDGKMLEYLTQYAPLLQALPNDEQVRISTGMRSRENHMVITLREGTREYDFPKITKWVKKSDLSDYNNGSITKDELLRRVHSADLSETTGKRDFSIFESILETAANTTDFEQLRVRRSSAYSYLPGFGVQFHVNANSRGGIFSGFFDASHFPDSNFSVNTDKNIDISFDFEKEGFNPASDEFLKQMDSIRFISRKSLDSLRVAVEDLTASFQEAFESSRQTPDPEKLSRDKEKLYDEIFQTIRQYGGTLTSLPDEEFITVLINWSGGAELPQRTYIRIKKNDLVAGRNPDITEVERR